MEVVVDVHPERVGVGIRGVSLELTELLPSPPHRDPRVLGVFSSRHLDDVLLGA